MIYLSDSFSLEMISENVEISLRTAPVGELKSIIKTGGIIPVIYNKKNYEKIKELLETNIPNNNLEISLKKGDNLILFYEKNDIQKWYMISIH